MHPQALSISQGAGLTWEGGGIRSPPGFLGRAPTGRQSGRHLDGMTSLKLAVAWPGASSPPTLSLEGGHFVCLPGAVPGTPASGNSGLQKTCTWCVPRRGKHAAIVYKMVPSPPRTWLQVEKEREKHTRHPVQNDVSVRGPPPFFTSFPISNSSWVPERKGASLKNN